MGELVNAQWVSEWVDVQSMTIWSWNTQSDNEDNEPGDFFSIKDPVNDAVIGMMSSATNAVVSLVFTEKDDGTKKKGSSMATISAAHKWVFFFIFYPSILFDRVQIFLCAPKQVSIDLKYQLRTGGQGR